MDAATFASATAAGRAAGIGLFASAAAPPYCVAALLPSGSPHWGTDGTVLDGTVLGQGVSVTYTFLTSAHSLSGDNAYRFSPLTATQRSAVRQALATWSAVANLTFTETAGAAAIAFGTNNQGGISAGYAYYPAEDATGGLVLFANDDTTNFVPTVGSYGFSTFVHEIGHALGLKHPGNYNAGGGGTEGPYLPAAEDNTAYSIMSYNDGPALPTSSSWEPSIYDIVTIQYLYGANTAAAPGNDSYSLTPSLFNTIWDPNGNNTLDGSAQAQSLKLDLRGGTFSYVGGTMATALAFGTRIVAARGGSGNDTITLNDLGDTVDAGGGFDTVVFSGRSFSYTIARSGQTISVSNSGTTSTLTNVERLAFDDRELVGAVSSPQALSSVLSASVAGTNLSIQQVSIPDTTDSVRGILSSKVQVNGQDISGVPATLKRGWKVGAIVDVSGDGASEIFFFGVDTVNGVGSGYGATWSLNNAGIVTDARLQIQMRRQGWEVAGAANVNGIPGDEVLWQNTLTGEKAIWTDINRDGTLDGGFVISGIGTNIADRIIGVSDLDRDGLKELLVFNDSTSALTAYEATPAFDGSVTAILTRSFSSFSNFQAAVTSAGASYTILPIVI